MLEQDIKTGTRTDTSRQKAIPKSIDIKDISNAKHIGKLVAITGTLTEKERTSFVARTMVEMDCTPNPDTKTCNGCRHLDKAHHEINLNVYNSEVLMFINTSQREIKSMYKEIAGIPKDCRKHTFSKFTVNKNLYRCGIIPCIDYVSAEKKSIGETVDNVYSIHIVAALLGDFECHENRDYKFIGVPHIDPADGRLIFLIDQVIPVADDISSFELTDYKKKLLSQYQCEHTPEAIRAKNAEILHEKRVNHHRVFGYGRMEYFMHMTFHSVSAFTFDGMPHYRGWLDGAIVGDSRTGKSEMLEKTIGVHQMGYRVACDNISYAGILGGMSQSSIKGGEYQLKWGLLPRLDRRIVGFDEAHNEDAIKLWTKLNDVRASGVAKVTKVGASDRSTKARVRKLFIANPPKGQTTNSFFYPAQMLPEIFPTPECIARLDFFYVPRIEDNNTKDDEDKKQVTPVYFGLRDKSLIAFIYSRTVDQVIFTKEAEEYIEEQAVILSKRSDAIHIPLIQGNEARFTFARGAASQAGAVWSVSEGCEHIIVHKAHAQVWIEELIKNYEHESNGYFKHSDNVNKKIKFANSGEFFQVCCLMRDLFAGTEGMHNFLLENNQFNFRHLRDMFGTRDHIVGKINSSLLRYSLIDAKSNNGTFIKTRRGIIVLKYLCLVGTKTMLDEKGCKHWFDKLSKV